MQSILNQIDKQLNLNSRNNLFSGQFPETMEYLPVSEELASSLKHLQPDEEQFILDYLTDQAIKKFCEVNQYYSISDKARNELRNIYTALLSAIKQNLNEDKENYDMLINAHFQRLQNWLKHSNPFSATLYSSKPQKLEAVPCAEYSPEFLIDLFKIDLKHITGPVLDIGCGTNANLVCYMRNKGIEAYGIDRFDFNTSFLERSDWLVYNYGINKWGCIISNLGFSNHFMHHHLREDGNYIGYAQKYMEILKSLKKNGSFMYAPSLPFIEMHLPKSKYTVQQRDLSHQDEKLTIKCTVVTRLY